MLKRVRELCGRALCPHQIPANLLRAPQQLLAIPAEMFPRDPDSGLLAIKGVQRVDAREDYITHVGALKCRHLNSLSQMGVDSTKDPWRTVARAPDHYSVCAGEIKYLVRFLRRIDVAVREDRNAYPPLDVANGVVLGGPCVKIRARAPVHGQRGNAAALGDAC